ncbi:MAG: outer membrane protein transport protein [Pseudomonadota bacterium]
MTRILALAAAASLSASMVTAGGIERTAQSVGVLFEQDRYVEFTFGAASPDVNGIGTAAIGGGTSGDLARSYLQFGAAFKADINETWSYAVIYDQPFGADTAYPLDQAYFARGAEAEFESHALTGILRYKFPSNFSVHAGLRVQSIEASATIPFVGNYSVQGDRKLGLGYLLGVAYEVPEIALRVALTYTSAIDYDVDTVENSPLGVGNRSVTEVTTPQSINLEFQTGIAEDTLLFGGVRWVEWSDFDISPADYTSPFLANSPLLSYENDYITYTIGVGRRLNDTWSVAGALSYEKGDSGFVTNLGPTDGLLSVGLSAVYRQDNMTITTGIRYIDIGNAQTRAGAAAPAGVFEDNHAVAFGVKVGYAF